MRHSPLILITLLALGTVEGIAWWWMHPAPAGHGEPVLAYRPVGLDRRPGPLVASGVESQGNVEARGQEEDPAQSSSSIQKSKINNQQSSISSTDHRSLITAHFSTTTTPLPEIYRQAAPMLRCTSGQVFHVKISDTASLHGAFFEWDGTDTGSVLEAFRHMPEACMGSIGMELVSKEKPIQYTVGLGRRAGPLVANGAESQGDAEDRSQESEVRGQEQAPASSSYSDQKSPINNPQSSISSSPSLTDNRQPTSDNSSISASTDHLPLLTDHSSSSSSSTPNIQSPISNLHLHFDHTVFRDPGQGGNRLVAGPLVHAFRAVWVSGTPEADARSGLDGRGFDQLRTIRLNSALTRYRPRNARVIQGAVRGMHTPEAAWAAFEEHMLRHLTFER